MTSKLFKRSVIAVSLAAVMAGGYAGLGGHAAAQTAAPPAAVAAAVPGSAVATDFSGIVKAYGPAVVNISVVGTAREQRARGVPSGPQQGPFGAFPFGPFGPFGPGGPGGAEPAPQARGMGSGFIVSADGMILTNAHVVEGADEVTVRLTDRREFKATVVGADRQTDVAVLRIDAKNLPTVKIGNPGASAVGEPVLAIGSPYGLENTATAGIISAQSRALPNDNYVPFIQTDVAVNPGNSGGPLFNLRGEVIGINSQIYSRTGGFQGLSFAVPIDVAIDVKDQLVKHGKVTRGRLGVSVQSITQSLAESLGLNSLNGALVASVERNGPAAKGGLEPGDVIVRFNGQEIRESSDLPARVARMQPGTQVKVEVLRSGKPQALNVTIGQMQDTTVAQRDDEPGAQQQGRLGLAVRPLDRQEQRSAGVQGGVLVEGVSGAAAKAGLERGDIVLSFNGAQVTGPEQLRDLARKSGRNAAVLVQRGEHRLFVPIELG
ncbi:MAG TPA: Do family serine endopeptidase [Noviherbaspirillum sp.]|nr:Do family serine endopeptidase [Noviherbaspirillum sp.]